ncbi:MAG: histidine kinase [Pseudomonadales bacterium]|nr:histidine kinase [Pseudomonadales bacterium]
MDNKTFGLRAWMEQLNRSELPAMAVVVHDLLRLAQSETASVGQLTEVLMRDAALATKVLRVSNSVYCNPGREVIKTLSRAVVVVGFDQVRMIGLSVSLLDGLLAQSPREQLQALLARSFHGAVQARNLAQYLDQRQQEEVFIATLLSHIGELAFWSHAGKQADRLAAALAEPGAEPEKVLRRELGVTFEQLTVGLLKTWNMGEIGQLVQASRTSDGPAARAVALGSDLAGRVAAAGWTDASVQALIEPVAELIGIDAEHAWQQLVSSGQEAVRVAGHCSNADLQQWIPRADDLPLDLSALLQMEVVPEPEQTPSERAPEPESEPLLQPNLELFKLSVDHLKLMVRAAMDVDTILNTLMQGLHRGAGIERVALMVLAEQKTQFRVRTAIGKGTQRWRDTFVLPCSGQPHVFSHALEQRDCLLLGGAEQGALNTLLTTEVVALVGSGPLVIAPVVAGSRRVGVLYGDMRLSGRALAQPQVTAFARMAELTGQCLQRLSQR